MQANGFGTNYENYLPVIYHDS